MLKERKKNFNIENTWYVKLGVLGQRPDCPRLISLSMLSYRNVGPEQGVTVYSERLPHRLYPINRIKSVCQNQSRERAVQLQRQTCSQSPVKDRLLE